MAGEGGLKHTLCQLGQRQNRNRSTLTLKLMKRGILKLKASWVWMQMAFGYTLNLLDLVRLRST